MHPVPRTNLFRQKHKSDMARDRRPVAIRTSQRQQRSRWQRERAKQRSVIIAGIIALLFIVGIPAYGYWTTFVAPPRSVVLQIDSTKYTLGFMHRYLEGLRAQGAEIDMSMEPFRFLQLLEQNELVRRGSISKGIPLTSEEVDQELKDRILGSSETLGDTPADQLEREFKERYSQYLGTIRLSGKEHRDIVAADLYRDKLIEQLGREVPLVAKQAELSWIVVSSDDQETVDDLSTRLEQGEDFGALADEFSADRGTATDEGYLGWIPEGAYPVLDDVIFSLEPGEISDAVPVQDSVYFLKVDGVAESREVEPEMLDQLKNIAFQTWLIQERGSHTIRLCFGGGSAGGSCDWQYDWVIKKLSGA